MLTDAQCRSATCPPGKTRARLTDAMGLDLEISPAGSKRWFWKTCTDGKESRLVLGSYPTVNLTAARAHWHCLQHRTISLTTSQFGVAMFKPAQSISRSNVWAAPLLALACLGPVSPALAYQSGDWVLARYQNGSYWYPGVVSNDSGQGVTVVYDDGDRETLASNRVKNYNWAIGSAVECNWKRGGKWYPGRIKALSGGNLSVAYDDGDRENTSTGMCRSK